REVQKTPFPSELLRAMQTMGQQCLGLPSASDQGEEANVDSPAGKLGESPGQAPDPPITDLVDTEVLPAVPHAIAPGASADEEAKFMLAQLGQQFRSNVTQMAGHGTPNGLPRACVLEPSTFPIPTTANAELLRAAPAGSGVMGYLPFPKQNNYQW